MLESSFENCDFLTQNAIKSDLTLYFARILCRFAEIFLLKDDETDIWNFYVSCVCSWCACGSGKCE